MASLDFRLATLGRLCLSDANERVVANGGKHLILLAYLSRSSPRPIRREVLATLLWGEKDETRARQSLRQALLRLKRELGDCLRVSTDVVAVDSVELDSAAFEADIEAGRLKEAIERWRGDFLLEQEDVGSEDYRTWVEAERAGLRRRLFWALARLVDEATHRRSYQEALHYATLWSEWAPFDDQAQSRRLAMLQLCDRKPDMPQATVRQPSLVGRGPQLAALEALWSRTEEEGSVVVIEGEQGIGKTSLGREFLRRRGKQSTTLVVETVGRASDVEPLSSASRLLAGLRYANGLAGASDRALAALSSVVPTLRERFPRLPTESKYDLAAALHEVLAAICEETPVLILFDDAHAADVATQQLLRDLMQRVPARALLAVTAERGWFDAFGRGSDTSNVRVIKLQPLNRDETAELVSSMISLDAAAREQLARELAIETDGNPFYIAALVSSYADTGRLCADRNGTWRLKDDVRNADRLPAQVREVVRGRTAQLSRDACALLDVVAVLPEPVHAATLERVASRLDIDFKVALPELLAAGIIEIPNGVEAYRCSKRLFRTAVAEGVAPTLRARIEVAAKRPRRKHRLVRVAAAGLVVAACSAGAITLLDDDSTAIAGSSHRLAVVELQNETGQPDLDPVGRIAAEYLTQGIARAALVKVTPPVIAREVAARAGSQSQPSVTKSAALETDANLIVSGSYYKEGDSIRFQTRITDMRTGRVVFALQSVRTPINTPTSGIEPLLEKNLAALGPLVQRRLSASASLLSTPPSLAAYREFERGLDYIYLRRGGDALIHMQRAYAMDTTWLLPMMYVGSVYAGQVQFTLLDSLLTHFLIPRRARLTPYESASLDAMVARVEGDVPRYYAAARAGAAIAPNSSLATVDLPFAAINLNLPAEALEVLMAAGDSSESEDLPARWLAMSSALHMLGKYEQQLDIAKRLQRKLPTEFRAVFYQGRALAALGRMKELDEVLQRSYQLPVEPNWGPHGMRMQVAVSDELRAHGHPEKAREVLTNAVRFYSRAPAEVRRILKFRFDYAQALYRLGRLKEARAIFEDLLRQGKVIGASEIILRTHVAYVAAAQGDLRTVRETEEWLKLYRQPYSFGQATLYRAALQALLGNREEAVRLLQQNIAEGGTYEGNTHTIFEFNSLQGYPPYEEWLRPKG